MSAADGNLVLYNSQLTGSAAAIYATNTYGTYTAPFSLVALPVWPLSPLRSAQHNWAR